MLLERFPLSQAVESERETQRRWKLDRLARLKEAIEALQAAPRLNDEPAYCEATITYPRRMRSTAAAPHR